MNQLEEHREVLRILGQSQRFMNANEIFERSGFRAKSRVTLALNELVAQGKVEKTLSRHTYYYRIEV